MLKINREVFFDAIRHGPFPGKLTTNQVSGMGDLLDVWEHEGSDDPRHLAYTFATNFHETGARMQPVREGFKTSDKAAREYVKRVYGHKGGSWYCYPAGKWLHVYYGRGDVQLTWFDNYVRMGSILKLPLAENPDLLLDSKISKRVMVEGMLTGVSNDGDFTGLALEDFFNDRVDDPTGARKIINGTDKAFLIAGYHDEFLEAIEAGQKARAGATPPRGTLHGSPTLPSATDQTSWGGALAVLGGLVGAISGFSDKLSGPTSAGVVLVVVAGAVLIARGRSNILKNTGE